MATMLRSSFTQVSRPAFASSSICVGRTSIQSSLLHTSAVVRVESPVKRAARLTRKRNIEKKSERQRLAQQNKPHVVLGIRSGDDAKWHNCDLAKILITADMLAKTSSTVGFQTNGGTVELPRHLSYGIQGEGKDENLKLLFDHLPGAAAEERAFSETVNVRHLNRRLEDAHKAELEKANGLARVLDLRNANARGIAFENRRRIITTFSRPDQPYDTGRPEVQVALLTLRIRNVWDHLMRSKKDVANRRSLRSLVHERAKMLRYLKRVDPDRYDRVLERCALEPESVEGELVV